MSDGSAANTKSLLMAGLPTAGKTSYLAAAWFALTQPAGSAEVSLRRLPRNIEFLNRLMDSWLNCQPADRTLSASFEDIRLELYLKGQPPFVLNCPDYSGEHVRDLWVKRRWPGHLGPHVREADAVLLFVNLFEIQEPHTIEEYAHFAQGLKADAPDPSRKSVPFDRTRAPSQTMLVEFLQFLLLRSKAKVLPVAVVLSAWDKLMGEAKAPAEQVASRLPLLNQFLVSNQQRMPNTAFGISAQGGDWPAEREALKGKPPSERAFAVASDGSPANVTTPMGWALTVV